MYCTSSTTMSQTYNKRYAITLWFLEFCRLGRAVTAHLTAALPLQVPGSKWDFGEAAGLSLKIHMFGYLKRQWQLPYQVEPYWMYRKAGLHPHL